MTKLHEAAPDLLKACLSLIAAFDNGADAGGSIEWSDLEDACDLAKDAVRKVDPTLVRGN